MVWEGYSLGGGGSPRPNRYRRRSTDTVYQRPFANRAGDKEKGRRWQEDQREGIEVVLFRRFHNPLLPERCESTTRVLRFREHWRA